MNFLKKQYKSWKERVSYAHASIKNVAEDFVETEGKSRLWSKRTKENYSALLAHYTRYKPHTAVCRIDNGWTDGFAEHLYAAEGLRNSTISTLLQQHRAVMKWAQAEGYDVRAETLHYTPRTKSVNVRDNVIALTAEEVRRLHGVSIASSALCTARDVFLFCCYTSLRYSDVKRLRRGNIADGWIDIVTQKTCDHLHIPLSAEAKEIIGRYGEAGSSDGDDRVLPVPSCVNYNINIKKVARMAGLSRMVTQTWFVGAERRELSRPLYEVISSHVARKTFVTLALSAGMPAEVLCTMTGHRDSRQLKHYCGVTREAQRQWMSHLRAKCNGTLAWEALAR